MIEDGTLERLRAERYAGWVVDGEANRPRIAQAQPLGQPLCRRGPPRPRPRPRAGPKARPSASLRGSGTPRRGSSRAAVRAEPDRFGGALRPPRPSGRRRRRRRPAPPRRAAGFPRARRPRRAREVRRQRHGDRHLGRLGVRPGAEDRRAAVAGKRGEERGRERGEAGREDDLPRRQVGRVGRHDVDREPRAAQRAVGGEHKAEVVEVAALRLRLPGPGRGVVEDDGDRRGAGRSTSGISAISRATCAASASPGAGRCRGAGGPRASAPARRGPAASGSSSPPRPRGRRPPTPRAAPCRQRRGVPGRPVHRARLLLHHPPAAPPHAAVEVVVEGLHVGVALPQVARLVRRARPRSGRQEAERVAVPACDVEVGAHGEMIEGERRSPCSCGSSGAPSVWARSISVCARLKRTT
jgi:hypothetical protein